MGIQGPGTHLCNTQRALESPPSRSVADCGCERHERQLTYPGTYPPTKVRKYLRWVSEPKIDSQFPALRLIRSTISAGRSQEPPSRSGNDSVAGVPLAVPVWCCERPVSGLEDAALARNEMHAPMFATTFRSTLVRLSQFDR